MKLLEKFQVDFIRVATPIDKWRAEVFHDGHDYLVPEGWETEALDDGSSVQVYRGIPVAKRAAKGFWYDPIYHPLENATIKDLEDFHWMPPFSFYGLFDRKTLKDLVKGLKEEAKRWYHDSDFALVGWFGGSVFEPAQGLRGFERFFLDTLENPEFLEALMDKLVDVNIEYAKYYLDAVEDYLQVILVGGEDMGAQEQMQISPDTYRKLVKPRHGRLWQFLK
jgi:uroporphyrinogen decarboxylase